MTAGPDIVQVSTLEKVRKKLGVALTSLTFADSSHLD